jgi:hypothetical protein
VETESAPQSAVTHAAVAITTSIRFIYSMETIVGMEALARLAQPMLTRIGNR